MRSRVCPYCGVKFSSWREMYFHSETCGAGKSKVALKLIKELHSNSNEFELSRKTNRFCSMEGK